jgi:small subunit ribosomal protein S13
MARIAGINLPLEKRIEIGLTYIYGIGLKTSQNILKVSRIDPNKRVKDLKSEDVKKISDEIDKNLQIEGELRQKINRNIRRLREVMCYRGVRHRLGLPVRGQRTKTNAVTRKGRNLAVGGLNPKISKT